uniref:Uncharacterized protein n=1 Tax=Anguilla anguilla TaxID=7936 RepID=A0A0E9SCI5_ANGAN
MVVLPPELGKLTPSPKGQRASLPLITLSNVLHTVSGQIARYFCYYINKHFNQRLCTNQTKVLHRSGFSIRELTLSSG